MKLLLLLLIPVALFGQFNLGSNGTNVPENLTPETIGYISEAWGDNTYVLRVRQDKDHLNESMINNIIALNEAVNLEVIFTFNTRPFGTNDLTVFDRLRSEGINIIAAEMGNEEYATQAGHLSAQDFYNKCVPIINSINARGFTGKIIFPIAPRPKEIGLNHGGKNSATIWNDYLATKINSNPNYEPVFHIYFNGHEYPAIKEFEDKDLPKADNYRDFFNGMIQAITTNDLIAVTCTYSAAKFPNKKMWITEFGAVVNSGGMSNTFGFELCRLWGLEQLENYNVQCVLIHNGVTTTPVGFINSTKRQDLNKNVSYQKRLGWYVLELYLNQKGEFIFNQAGHRGKFINAEYADQSAGHCSWWLDNRASSYELGEYSDVSSALSFGYIFDSTITVCDTVFIPVLVYDTTFEYITEYDTTIITTPIPKVTYSLRIDNNFNEIGYIFFDKLDTINYITFNFDTVIKPVYLIDTIITERTEYIPAVNCDTITEPIIQPLDADTLIFNNEIEFEEFLDYHGIADYEVLPAKFNPDDKPEDVLPMKYMTNKSGNRVLCPDPNYYVVPVNSEQAYLNEALFHGKRYVAIFDHSGFAKQYREFYTEYCPQGDYRTVDAVITNPTNGQVAVFNNMYVWSDRSGEQIFNTNLKLWLLWGTDINEQIYSFVPFMPDSTSGCDFSFKQYTEGHETMELRFHGMKSAYGYLLKQ